MKARHVDVVKLLVDAGANVDARDERGVTPLHLAAVNVQPDDPKEMSRFEKVVDILVSASASVNVLHPDTGESSGVVRSPFALSYLSCDYFCIAKSNMTLDCEENQYQRSQVRIKRFVKKAQPPCTSL